MGGSSNGYWMSQNINSCSIQPSNCFSTLVHNKHFGLRTRRLKLCMVAADGESGKKTWNGGCVVSVLAALI